MRGGELVIPLWENQRSQIGTSTPLKGFQEKPIQEHWRWDSGSMWTDMSRPRWDIYSRREEHSSSTDIFPSDSKQEVTSLMFPAEDAESSSGATSAAETGRWIHQWHQLRASQRLSTASEPQNSEDQTESGKNITSAAQNMVLSAECSASAPCLSLFTFCLLSDSGSRHIC